MKVLIVDESGALDALARELQVDGLEARRPSAEALALAEAAGSEVAEIAGALTGLERLLADGGADALLLGSASNLALAAVVVATKAGVPVAAVRGGFEPPGPELNARLIAELADAVLPADAPVVAGWLRGPGAG
jgi:hypothetical protein